MASKPLNLKSKNAPRRHRTPKSLSKEAATLRSVQKLDEHKTRPDSRRRELWLASIPLIVACRKVAAVMPQVEHKEVVPTYRGTSAPADMVPPQLGYRYQDTKESLILRDSFRALFGDKHYRFRIGTVLNMSSNGANAVNSTLSVSALQFTADFVSLSTVFNEFFVVAMDAIWQPVSRYQSPGGPQAATFDTNIPLGTAELQHGATAYSSLSLMADNYNVTFQNTGTPFNCMWTNVEKVSETVVAEQSSNTQSWCTTGNVANYQGQLQFISQAAPPKLPVSTVLGTFMTHWDVVFRVRI